MIKEYALDPAILQSWSSFRHVGLGIGFGVGRVLARYPKDWVKMAAGQIAKSTDQNDKKKLETWLLDRARAALVGNRAGAQYDHERSWTNNAIAEHARQRFDAILSTTPSSVNPPILNLDDADDEHPLWKQARQEFIARNEADISRCVRSMLGYATVIRFIDPYFKGDPDQIRIIVACLSVCAALQNRASIRVELHVDGVQVAPGTAVFIAGRIQRTWPPGMAQPTFVRWRQGYLHDRLILTNVGGFILGDSLRRDEDRPDQISLLEGTPWEHWWNRHDAARHAGDLAM
jgi:hypothetical protein